MTRTSIQEYTGARRRYLRSPKTDKSKILNEFINNGLIQSAKVRNRGHRTNRHLIAMTYFIPVDGVSKSCDGISGTTSGSLEYR